MTIRTALFWIAAACCVFAEVAILRSLLFGARAERRNSRTRAGRVVGRSNRPTEVAWALLPAVGLLFVLYLTWRAVERPSSAAIRISVAPARPSEHDMNALRRLSILSLILGVGQVVFGAIVRITGSGLGCGDHWPKCEGHWFPPLDRTGSHHRGVAPLHRRHAVGRDRRAARRRPRAGAARRALVGRGGVLRAASLASTLVVIAALFGAVTVKLELGNKLVIVTHLAIAMTLLAVLVSAVMRAGGLGAASADDRNGIGENVARSTGSVGADLPGARDGRVHRSRAGGECVVRWLSALSRRRSCQAARSTSS